MGDKGGQPADRWQKGKADHTTGRGKKRMDALERELEREKEKLARMELGDPGILAQSRIVDALVVERTRKGFLPGEDDGPA